MRLVRGKLTAYKAPKQGTLGDVSGFKLRYSWYSAYRFDSSVHATKYLANFPYQSICLWQKVPQGKTKFTLLLVP